MVIAVMDVTDERLSGNQSLKHLSSLNPSQVPVWQYEALCDGLGLGGERWKGKLSHEVMLHTSAAFFFPFFLLSLNLIFFFFFFLCWSKSFLGLFPATPALCSPCIYLAIM